MPMIIGSRSISHVVVIGSGQIGPDIALHFAKVLEPFGGQVTVIDVSEQALASGKAKVFKKIDKGAETGAWKPAQAEAMKAMLAFTPDYASAATADLVVEAATEDEALKGRIFTQLEKLCRADTIFLSNSSHLEPERIFAPLRLRQRTAVAHYFFPAERNPIVEIVSSDETDPALTAWLLRFYEATGKVPIAVKSRYGYAADPIFEGIFQAACLAVEEGLGTVKEVDFAARAALGMTVGPFTAMNLTGGNPITQHGLNLMHTRLGSWFYSPKLLDDMLATDGKWAVCGRGETVTLPADQDQRITEALRGAYLGLCFGIIDSGIVTLGDYEVCIEMALDLIGPCRLANKLGVAEALRLVKAYAADHPGFSVPMVLRDQAEAGKPFAPPNLIESDLPGTGTQVVRLVRVRRPKVLNALNHATYHELAAAFARAAADPHVAAVVLAGFGTKAFVSGADINALNAVKTPEEGWAIAKLAQDVARQVERMDKPVVAALTGIAFGGGLELAMGCHARVAVEGQRVLCALPEVNLGLIPAGGGTQRLPRLIGLDKAQAAIRTGTPLGSADALALGLVAELAPADAVIDRAAQRALDMAAGKTPWIKMNEGPVPGAPTALPEIDIGHRSRKVDELVTESLLYGAQRSLDEGLARELDVFRRICALQDMRIGVGHFVANGAKTPAPFVHA